MKTTAKPSSSDAVLKETMRAGAKLGLDHQAMVELNGFAGTHQRKLNRLAKAHSVGEAAIVKALTLKVLGSFAAKMSAIVRDAKKDGADHWPTIQQLRARANTTSALHYMPEPVTLTLSLKGNGEIRPIASFGPRRRAAQIVCRDILELILPAFPFAFPGELHGREAAIERLLSETEKENANFVVVADIKNCFGSPIMNKLCKLLPLPERAVRNALLIEQNVKLGVKHGESVGKDNQSLVFPTTYAELETNSAAPQGLPQGSLASPLIAYQAVLGPLLATLPFVNRLVQYCDNFAVPSKDKVEAEYTLKTLQSLLSTSPVGPLTIGSHEIANVTAGFDYLGYHIVRKSDGQLHLRPSSVSYLRVQERAVDRYLKAGGGQQGQEAVAAYVEVWIKAFPRWKPTDQSKTNLLVLLNTECQAVAKPVLHEPPL